MTFCKYLELETKGKRKLNEKNGVLETINHISRLFKFHGVTDKKCFAIK